MLDAEGPIFAYRARLSAGEWTPDPAQELAVEKLQTLHNRLRSYRAVKGATWLERLRRDRREPPPEGLYRYGGVGRGKSVLMDLFYASAPIARKRRAHFHAFMLDVHARIHAWRQREARERADDDPIRPVAKALAEEATLLCLDELQVSDVADAMILRRLFAKLFQNGMVVVTTSNTAPEDLYAGGLKSRAVHALYRADRDGPRRHVLQRRARLSGSTGCAARRSLSCRWGPRPTPPSTPRSSASPTAPRPCHWRSPSRAAGSSSRRPAASPARRSRRCAGGPWAPPITSRWRVSFTPCCWPACRCSGPERIDEARRFINLIDILYEHRVNLLCGAAAAPDRLYDGARPPAAFARTVSRIEEMQSDDYLAAPHLG